MTKVAIITARGGSKRIPGKNIKEFCGKPIISYSIQAALESKLFDEVMVSTDSLEIADVAQQYGAIVPFFRSASTSDDYAVMAEVLQEVLDKYKAQVNMFDVMCCIYPTAPFVTGSKLQAAYDVFEKSGAEMLQSVVPFSYPPQRSFCLQKDFLVYNFPEHVRSRSQDLETWYHDAGQFYFYNVEAFLSSMKENTEQGGYSLRCVPFMLTEIEVQDIDNQTDWTLAEVKYHLLQGLNN